MNDIREQHRTALRDMIAAFVRISDMARRAGVDEREISVQHGAFFDGKVSAQDALGVAAFLAEVRMRTDRPEVRED